MESFLMKVYFPVTDSIMWSLSKTPYQQLRFLYNYFCCWKAFQEYPISHLQELSFNFRLEHFHVRLYVCSCELWLIFFFLFYLYVSTADKCLGISLQSGYLYHFKWGFLTSAGYSGYYLNYCNCRVVIFEVMPSHFKMLLSCVVSAV